MKSILGKKLGMSQMFDPESGTMTPVTVIEAGPCPVVQVKTADTDGYDAVQLAFDAVAERKLSKAEVGHLKKAGVGPHRHLVEFRGESGLVGRRDRDRRGVRAGRQDQGVGHLDRQGLPGHDQAARVHAAARSRTARTTSASPGSIGASAYPSRVFKGMRMSGRMGGTRVTQPGLVVHEVDVERNLLIVKGSVPGPKSGLAGDRSA